MFERYEAGTREKGNKWFRLTIAVSLAAHIVGGTALAIYSFWKIEKIEPKVAGLEFKAVPQEPEAAAAAAPPRRKSTVKKAVVPTKPKELTQPDKDPKPNNNDAPGPASDVDGKGNADSIGTDPNATDLNGDPDSTNLGPGGDGTGGGDAPPPPAPTAPAQVAQQMVEGNLISSNMPAPATSVLQMLVNQGVKAVKTQAKICVNEAGAVTSVELAKTSGYAEVDSHVLSNMRRWKFRPYSVAGKATPFCAKWILKFDMN